MDEPIAFLFFKRDRGRLNCKLTLIVRSARARFDSLRFSYLYCRFLALLLLFLPLVGQTKEYHPGDLVSLRCGPLKVGKSVKLGQYVDTGGTSVIFQLADDPAKAIRLPKDEKLVQFGPQMLAPSRFITFFINGYRAIKDAGVPVIEMYDYCKGKYVIVDYVDDRMSLKDFLIQYDHLDIQMRETIFNSLLDFALTTFAFDDIGDFKSTSLVYTKSLNRWRLIDFTQHHRRHKDEDSDETPFNYLFKEVEILQLVQDGVIRKQLLDSLILRIDEAIELKRHNVCEADLNRAATPVEQNKNGPVWAH